MIFNANKKNDIKDFYNCNSYAIIEPIVSKDELKEISALVDKKMDQFKLGSARVVDMNDLALKIEDILHHIFKAPLVSIVQDILECSYLDLQHSKYNSKDPNGGSQVPLHQDFPFFPHTDDRILALNFHLDGSSFDNGGMFVYPGKWKKPLPHDDTNLGFKEISSKHIKDTQKVYFDCPPGGITLHSTFIPHGSGETSNNARRRVLVFQLRNPENKQIGGCIWKCNGYNPVTLKYNNPVYNLNGEVFESRNLWEPKEYFENKK